MKTFKYSYDISPNLILNEFDSVNNILFIDIETTGLSASNSTIYLIGAGYYNKNGYNIIQWFAETPLEEPLIIKAFFEFASNFSCLLHFNGQMFDIPFIQKRSERHKINSDFSAFNSIDIYKLIKPLKNILGLQDVRQKTLELFLGIYREDMYSGGELIPVYKKYTLKHDDSLLKLLLLHNEEDVLNMHNLIPILEYRNIKNIYLNYEKHVINEYTAYDGSIKKELLITYSHTYNLPVDFKANNNGIYINYSNSGTIIFRLPVECLELKYYYPDPENYYYLPLEDTCIHKSIASGVDKSHRKRATKANCYTKCPGEFIKCGKYDKIRLFKDDYKSKEQYALFSIINELSADEMNVFGKSILEIN